ncbi:alanine dehydrogenase [Candidatus Woesearchaeota archaeon]|nr:alanine dehydrogenase [Candidatus Woesearchaeota archaeon]
MNIATLKEIKDNENRVGLTPQGTEKLTQKNHQVIVQKNAGNGAGFSNKEYIDAGAEILDDPKEIVKKSDILVKVKEPLESEYGLLELFKGKTLFTYLHLSGVPKSLTKKLLENRITGIAYETVENNGTLPLLAPMSQVAGVLAIQYGAEYLQKKYGGRGITLGRIDNTPTAKVIVIGGGVVGCTSAATAAGMGSSVKLFEIDDEKIKKLKEKYSEYENIEIIKSSSETISENIKDADLVVGAVLIAGAKAPVVVNKDMVHSMKKGSVIVDVAIDQGGCVFGSCPTSHTNPICTKENGIIYCCVPNMPGQVALQSTQALTNSTLPYLIKLADKGMAALKTDPGFLKGLNTYNGKIVNKVIAKDLDMMDLYQEIN